MDTLNAQAQTSQQDSRFQFGVRQVLLNSGTDNKYMIDNLDNVIARLTLR